MTTDLSHPSGSALRERMIEDMIGARLHRGHAP